MKVHLLKDPSFTVCGQRASQAKHTADVNLATCRVCKPTYSRPPSATVPREVAEQLYRALMDNSSHPTGCGWLKGRACDCGLDGALEAARAAGLGKESGNV